MHRPQRMSHTWRSDAPGLARSASDSSAAWALANLASASQQPDPQLQHRQDILVAASAIPALVAVLACDRAVAASSAALCLGKLAAELYAHAIVEAGAMAPLNRLAAKGDPNAKHALKLLLPAVRMMATEKAVDCTNVVEKPRAPWPRGLQQARDGILDGLLDDEHDPVLCLPKTAEMRKISFGAPEVNVPGTGFVAREAVSQARASGFRAAPKYEYPAGLG